MTQFWGLGVLLFWILGIVGWVMNIFVLYEASFTPLTGAIVLRAIGMFVVPLGAVLGLFF